MTRAHRPTAWRSYFEGTALLTAELERRLKDETGLTLAEFNVLLALDEAPGHTLRMGDLARTIVFSPARLTYLVQQLEKRGWVRREPCPQDSRGVNATLTDVGRREFRRARPVHGRHVEELFLARVADADIEVLDRVFTPLRRDLTAAR